MSGQPDRAGSIETVELFAKRYGSGPPLLILHGLLGAGGNWHTLSRGPFGERFTVYALDLRNHGRSPHHARFDYPAMVADVVRFLDAHDLEAPYVLGHSMGGKAAMHLALAHPGRVDKLVVADISPREYPPAHEPIFEALESVDFSSAASREDVDEQLAGGIPSKAVRQFLMKNLQLDGDAYSWQMALETIHANYSRINEPVESDGTFDGPVLFVRGGASDYVRDADEAEIRALFPQARFTSIPGAGHWLHADAPEAFAAAVTGFLSGDGARGGR